MAKLCFATCRFVGRHPSPRELQSGENQAIIIANPWLYNPPEPIPKECPDPELDFLGYTSWLYGDLPKPEEVDGYVFYLPSKSFWQALEAIKPLAGQNVGLVMCRCNAERHKRMLEEAGFGRHILTAEADCGGYEAMEQLLINFLETGDVSL